MQKLKKAYRRFLPPYKKGYIALIKEERDRLLKEKEVLLQMMMTAHQARLASLAGDPLLLPLQT